jgi:hypothetical protein
MDQDTARVGAQELDRESLKKGVPPDFGEKITDESSPHTSQTSIDPERRPGVRENHDVEAVVREEVTPAPEKVPRSKRRGLFGRFTLLAEVKEPKHYPRRTKWWITFVIALAAVAAPMGSAIVFRKSSGFLQWQAWYQDKWQSWTLVHALSIIYPPIEQDEGHPHLFKSPRTRNRDLS